MGTCFNAEIGPDGLLRWPGGVARAALGRGGIRADKREGDGATPAGLLALRALWYRPDRLDPPACHCPRQALTPDQGWCDDPADPAYNQPVRLPYPARHEILWRADALYDLIGVLGWNDAPPIPGLGSAIFLHLATLDYRPTEGCIALALPDLLGLLGAGLAAIRVWPQPDLVRADAAAT